eukprot:scaffold28784_cov53-Attheya_sp.AAC.6
MEDFIPTGQVFERPHKRVCFPALDSEEEDRRTERGVELRRQQKEERKLCKMAMQNPPATSQQVYAVSSESEPEDETSTPESEAEDENPASNNMSIVAAAEEKTLLGYGRFTPLLQQIECE